VIELAVAAEELGADGAYFRVHHFARQLASPFPLVAAVGARTSRIEIGTGVIDMRYENPLKTPGLPGWLARCRARLGAARVRQSQHLPAGHGRGPCVLRARDPQSGPGGGFHVEGEGSRRG